MLVMDEPNRFYFYDDMNGNAEPLKKYADAGHLDRSRAYPLSTYELGMNSAIAGIEQAIMLQNMYLGLQAMGLGGWIFSSSVGAAVMPMMGFRMQLVTKEGPFKPLDPAAPGRPVVVGLDGLFEPYCPPYYPDMAAAVQAVWDAKWGSGGIYREDGGPAAYRDRQSLDRGVAKTPDWCLEATKELCGYIWETYGRFPVLSDPMVMSIWFQAHHLETEFYDRYYHPVGDGADTWYGRRRLRDVARVAPGRDVASDRDLAQGRSHVEPPLAIQPRRVQGATDRRLQRPVVHDGAAHLNHARHPAGRLLCAGCRPRSAHVAGDVGNSIRNLKVHGPAVVGR